MQVRLTFYGFMLLTMKLCLYPHLAAIWITDYRKKLTSGSLPKLLFWPLTCVLKTLNQAMSWFLWAWNPFSHVVEFLSYLKNGEDSNSLPGIGLHPQLPFTWDAWGALWLVVLGIQTLIWRVRILAGVGEVCFGNNWDTHKQFCKGTIK